MAVRKKLNHDEKTRQKIQTSQIINRLNNHVLGKNKMTSTQIRAAEILLKKTTPDLQSIEHTGDDNSPLSVQIIRYGDITPTK